MMPIRNAVAAGLLLAAAVPAAAQAAPSKLIVAIAIDQFGSDVFDAYRSQFTGGLKRLSSGTVYRNGFQAHAATETCPGHSTILTGSHPARSGIVANNWFDPSLPGDKKVYCAEDVGARPAGGGYSVSPQHLKVATLGDRLKAADPRTRIVSVAGKDRAAVMLAGRSGDQVFWWGGKGFTSNLTPRPAAAVASVNAAIAKAIASPRPDLVAPPACEARAERVDIPGDRDLGVARFGRAAGDSAAFRLSPEMDGATLALAAGLAREMRLGAGPATDLLAIGLSATDYVGHAYGSGGIEMCLQLMSLDRDLGAFLRVLDGLGAPYQVVLTADHGVLDVPERTPRAGEARVDAALTVENLDSNIRSRLGLSTPVLIGEGVSDIYVVRTLAPSMRQRVLAEAQRYLAAHPQVASVHLGSEIGRLPLPSGAPDRWTVPQRLRASYDSTRSGDLLAVLKSGITPIANPGPTYAATHGSPWDYDRRVPILFWRSGAASEERSEAVATVDILPTIAAMIGLPIPRGTIDGRCLAVRGAACPRP